MRRRRSVDIHDMSTLNSAEQLYYSHIQKRFREGGYLLYPRPNVLLPSISSTIPLKEFIFNETVSSENVAMKYNYNRSILKNFGKFASVYYAGDTNYRTFSLVSTFVSDDVDFDHEKNPNAYDSLAGLSNADFDAMLSSSSMMTAQDKADCFIDLINLRIPWCIRSAINGKDMICEIEITDITHTLNATILTKPSNGVTTPEAAVPSTVYSQDYVTVTISCTEIDEFLAEDELDFPEIGIEIRYSYDACSYERGYRGMLVDYDNSNRVLMTFSTQNTLSPLLLTTNAMFFSNNLTLVSQSTGSRTFAYKKLKLIIEEKIDVDDGKQKTFISLKQDANIGQDANLGFYVFNTMGNDHDHGIPMDILINQNSIYLNNWNFPCVQGRTFNINDLVSDIYSIPSVALFTGTAPTTIMYPIARIDTRSSSAINIFQVVKDPNTGLPYEYNTARIPA